ncbi:zinc ribbon domain-containing protein [Cupriavidus gilardii]|uniref:zinc ribbon domain-containing protein n=1 Tax=Cupriavidus gilardii TaxID=82541 RepID=UPI0021C22045|nr:zinc ribbon domain-containing protein [Cupriavidus gilardii]MCT9017105.1 zinc ribbon domain-containing protein [Cupriavidus gilardii]MCT9056775.1 zinc ribbon domain-containing protein [Cupriavidus gilardii]
MAIIKCSECGGDVSDKALACPKCGNPIARTPPIPQRKAAAKRSIGASVGRILGTVVIVVAVFIVVVVVESPPKKSAEASADVSVHSKSEQRPAECQADDLRCIGEKLAVEAEIRCKRPIEQLAKHSVKWTDGVLDMKFSRYRWAAEPGGTVTYIGDKVEFQNGFGAFTPMIYECDLAADGKSVLDVRIHQGRLPG